ncbi:ribosomal maturation YjgA family protein [Plantactinospora sonchi]|uniref:DUF2809 domain-containing protein n=1 Tax=Plantactinospora sonchi TaxID=1544735 RepID=A0ABU7S508_9ACTN
MGTSWRFRLSMVGAAAGFLVVAMVIRALDDGAVAQHSGTLLYGSMVYVAVLFVAPRLGPVRAGVIATAFCWLVEVAQLTGVPAALSARSLLARLVLGVRFDPVDLAWYPVGVLPLVAVPWLLTRLAQRRMTRSGLRPGGSDARG